MLLMHNHNNFYPQRGGKEKNPPKVALKYYSSRFKRGFRSGLAQSIRPYNSGSGVFLGMHVAGKKRL